MKTELPEAAITLLQLTADHQGQVFWLVRVRCPHCRSTHTHGGGDGPDPNLGSRVPHCATTERRSEYVLTVCSQTRISSDSDYRYADSRRREHFAAVARNLAVAR